MALLVAAVVLVVNSGPASASYELVSQWGSTGSGEGQFNGASGIAVDSADNVYIADTQNNRVQKFSPSGAFVAEWGSTGSGEGQFNGPVGIAVDSRDDLYVADFDNHRVQKFDSSGTFLTQWGGEGLGDGKFGLLTAITVDAEDKVYVADSQRVQKFDSSGAFIARRNIGVVTSFAVDSQNRVFASIASFPNPIGFPPAAEFAISRLDASLNVVDTWGSLGPADGELGAITAIVMDSADNVLVADYNCYGGYACIYPYASPHPTHGLQKFEADGRYQMTVSGPIPAFVSTRGGLLELELGPSAIAVNSRGHLVVLESWRDVLSQVRVFKETTPWTLITSGPRNLTSDSTPKFSFSSNALRGGFECTVDGASFAPCEPSHETAELADGEHELAVRALDPAGSRDPTPATRSFTVDTVLRGSAAAKGTQTKRGNKVKVRVKLKGKERLDAKATGKIIVRNGASAADATSSKRKRTYRLGAKSKSLREGQDKTVFLKPNKRKHVRKIAKALKQGLTVRARPRVKLSDRAGNTETEKLRVKLRGRT